MDNSCTNFVLGNKCVLGEDEIVFLDKSASRRIAEMRPSGTLESWRTDVAQWCAGNPIMLVAVSRAFVGPLVGLLGRESFGLHLSGRSGHGQATTAKAAVSVWPRTRCRYSLASPCCRDCGSIFSKVFGNQQ
ncbi:MAG: DUF927 domain-containing protein [Roseovarius sp.]